MRIFFSPTVKSKTVSSKRNFKRYMKKKRISTREREIERWRERKQKGSERERERARKREREKGGGEN